MSLSGRPRTKQYGPRSSNNVTRPSPRSARPSTTACSACRSARCAPVAPCFGPPTPTDSAPSPVEFASRERSDSAYARASTGPVSSRTAAATPARERTTRASGASSATVTRRRAAIAASRDANAIAMYALGPLVTSPPLTTKKASLFGRPSWKSALVIALAAASRTHTVRPKHGEGDVHDRDDAKRHVCGEATGGLRAGQGAPARFAYRAQDCALFEGGGRSEKGEVPMATFITLARYTQQGISK